MFVDTDAANKNLRPKIVVSPHSASRYEESATPLLETFVGQDAPPSYLEATTPGLWHGRPSDVEGAGLLGYDGEASGSGGNEIYKRRGSGAGYRRRSFREHCSKKRWLKWLAAILLLVSLAAIMAAVAAAGSDKKASVTPVPVPSAQLAENEGTQGGISGGVPHEGLEEGLIAKPTSNPMMTPAQPAVPVQSKANFPIRWPAHCGKQYNTKSEEYDFGSPTDLTIQEAVHQLDGPYKRVSGWIHVTRAPDSQAEGTIQARMAYAISSSVDVNSVKYASTANGLTIGEPSFPDGFDGVQPGTACMGISVVLYVARGTTLTNLKIASTHMGMQVHKGVEFSVANSTSISLTTGTLDSVSFNSRETHLETISGSISGKYSLFDLVSIKTISGSVNVNIEPREAVGSQSAIFLANSLSGSIRADFERKRIPERDYQVWINTTVGSVDGTFIHGSKTVINSVAGMVNADLLPFKSDGSASTIDTTSDSGQSSILVRSPYKAKGVPMTGLTSVHKSVSGAVELIYPQEWEGYLEGTSSNGTLHLQGRDLELVKEEEEPGRNYVEAKKGAGKGASSVTFRTVSGGCDVKVGKT